MAAQAQAQPSRGCRDDAGNGVPEPEVAETEGYRNILKSSAIVGGSSAINIAIGMIRTKATAILLGPAGFGLAGLYMSVANLTQAIAGMGVNTSGVRQIAEAVGSGNQERVARTADVLRKTSLILGCLGAAVLIVFSRELSTLSFGARDHAAGISLLSLVVFFNLVSAGQGALIQGLRRMSDLAQISILGAASGTVVTIPLVYFLRQRGIVPSLVAVAALSLLTSSWYSRKVRIPTRSVAVAETAKEASALLRLGFAFMASSLMMMGNGYLVRIIIVHTLGLEATGFYQSAWTIGGLYTGVILGAMGTDFYPRLTARADDNAACNRLVNEQVRISLLLGGIGIIATITFAPLAMGVFYSAKFAGAVGVLRWICLGTALQTITWPLGFIIIAKAEQALFFWCEVAWGIASVVLAWLCIRNFGANGAGIAFFASYVFHGLLIYPIVRRLSGFRWSSENMREGVIYGTAILTVFWVVSFLPMRLAVCIGATIALLMGVYSMRTLLRLTRESGMPTSLVSRVLSTRWCSALDRRKARNRA